MDPNHQQTSDWLGLVPFAYGIALLEVAVAGAVVAISLGSAALLCSTRILHPNLRCILVAQSASIALTALTRILTTSNKLASDDIFAASAAWIQVLGTFAISCRNSIGHILLAERVMATVWSRNYEHFGWKWFTGGWTLIVLALCAGSALTSTQSWTISRTQTLGAVLLCCCGLVELSLIGTVGYCNWRRYASIVPNPGQYSLSQKFQLSENVRTCWQLAPAFGCNLADNLLMLAIACCLHFGWPGQPRLLSPLFGALFTLYAVLGALAQITVINRHPALKHRFGQLSRNLAFWRRSNRIEDGDGGGTATAPVGSVGPTNLHGDPLIRNQQMDEHFRMLQSSWQ